MSTLKNEDTYQTISDLIEEYKSYCHDESCECDDHDTQLLILDDISAEISVDLDLTDQQADLVDEQISKLDLTYENISVMINNFISSLTY